MPKLNEATWDIWTQELCDIKCVQFWTPASVGIFVAAIGSESALSI